MKTFVCSSLLCKIDLQLCKANPCILLQHYVSIQYSTERTSCILPCNINIHFVRKRLSFEGTMLLYHTKSRNQIWIWGANFAHPGNGSFLKKGKLIFKVFSQVHAFHPTLIIALIERQAPFVWWWHEIDCHSTMSPPYLDVCLWMGTCVFSCVYECIQSLRQSSVHDLETNVWGHCLCSILILILMQNPITRWEFSRPNVIRGIYAHPHPICTFLYKQGALLSCPSFLDKWVLQTART